MASSSSSAQPSPPDFRGYTHNSFCMLGMQPLLVQGMLINNLRDHFSHPRNIELPQIRNLIWAGDVAQSAILIEATEKWMPEKTGQRPALLVSIGAWRFERLGVDDRLDDGETDQEEYAKVIVGSATVFGISATPAQARLLATEAYRELLGYAPKLREELNLLRFSVAEVGEMFQVKEATENYAVPVTVAIANMERWAIRPEAPKLKTISFGGLEL